MIEIRVVDGGIEIPLHVVPGSSREGVRGEHDGCLRLAVTAPPEGGQANRAVVRVVAAALGVRPNAVTLVAGAASRRKRVRIEGLDESAARRALTTS